MIGHEITHGFDDQGRQNDKDGNALPWWTNETLQAFQTRAQCIVDQYGSIRLPELDEHLPNATLNGINTQVSEWLKDNAVLRYFKSDLSVKGVKGFKEELFFKGVSYGVSMFLKEF